MNDKLQNNNRLRNPIIPAPIANPDLDLNKVYVTKPKGALSRIKDSIKAVPSKIKSGMKSLAHNIKSSFHRKPSVEEAPAKTMIVKRESSFGADLVYKEGKTKPGLLNRTKTKVADMGRAIANKGSSLWNALSCNKKDKLS